MSMIVVHPTHNRQDQGQNLDGAYSKNMLVNNPMLNKLEKLHHRLFKVGVYVTFSSNHPWVYLETVNTKVVKETHDSEHGFVIGYTTDNKFVDIPLMFETIRKYL